MSSHWAKTWIGKKPEEVGFCWGLLRLVYGGFGIALPEVLGLTLENSAIVAARAVDDLASDWREIPLPFEGCVVAMSQASSGYIHHVGVYTGSDGGRVVHCWGRGRVVADDFRGLRLKGFNLLKFYRHKLWPS